MALSDDILIQSCIRANQCAQYVDDIGILANNPQQLILNMEAVFASIQKAGLKVTLAKCHFGVQQVDFLGRTNTPEGIGPSETQNNEVF